MLHWLYVAGMIANLAGIAAGAALLHPRYWRRYAKGPYCRWCARRLRITPRIFRRRLAVALFTLWLPGVPSLVVPVVLLLAFTIPNVDDVINGHDRPPRRRTSTNRVRWARYRPGRHNPIGAPA